MNAEEALNVLTRKSESRERISIWSAIRLIVEAIKDIVKRLQRMENTKDER